MDNRYTKVTYQSNPIGKEKIVLYLTTFDLEAFKNDEKLERIPTKMKAIKFEFNRADLLNNSNLAEEMNNKFEKMFKETYQKQLEEMKSYIEINRKLPKAQWYEVGEKMLKIKDNVDLKKIGCDISDDEFDQLWAYKELLFDKNSRIIWSAQFMSDLVDERLNNLYDLIKADLVEKVGE